MVCIELSCYLTLFQHIYYHDNHVMVTILDAKVITMRNRVNAVTLKGLFATWVMDASYYCWMILFLTSNDYEQMREMLTIVKMSEFAVVPIVQVLTSPAVRKAIWNS